MEARTQGSRLKTQKIPRARLRTDLLEAKAENTGTSVLRKKKVFKSFFRRSPKKKKAKKGLQKNFLDDLRKKRLQNIFPALHKILTIQKILLSSSRGQANFRGLGASRPRPRTAKCIVDEVLEAKDVLKDSTSAK